MTAEEFAERIQGEPRLQGPFVRAQEVLVPESRSFGTDLLIIGLLYPVIVYLFKNVGLPWLNTSVKLSNLQLAKVHQWIDEQYKSEGFDQEKLKKSADELWNELTQTKSPIDQKLWEDLRKEVLAQASNKNK